MCKELIVELKESPIEIYKKAEELNEEDKNEFLRKARHNFHWILDSWTDEEFNTEYDRITAEHGNFYKILNEVTRKVVNDVDCFVKSYNYSDCDGMIDYFHVDFYYFGCCKNNGVNIKVVPKTARIKKKNSTLAKADRKQEEKKTIEEKKKYTFKVTYGEDTRDGSELWVVRIMETLDKSEYIRLNKIIKDLGGYYSKFKHGFIFRFNPSEKLENIA